MKSLKLFLGSGLGTGLLPKFPGTWGSLFALIPIYCLVSLDSLYFIPAFVLVTSLLTLWVSKACEEEWGQDPGKLVIDEWAGQGVVFISISFTGNLQTDLMILAVGFIFFRVFDILKPLGINKLQKYGERLGILADDLLAGLYALICLKTLIFVWPQ